FLQHHPVHRQPGHHHQRQRDRLPGQPLTGPPGPGLPSRRRTPDAEALRIEAVYRKTGYYENETILDYFCSITLYTDSRDIITNASVIDCRD
ncbi:hypothetical protein ACUS6I_31975, partial [Pseudomonas aeruginosa]